MPKSVAVDVQAFLDAVDAEYTARVCPPYPVYRRGMEPMEWHLRAEHWQYGCSAVSGAGRGAAVAPARSRSAAERAASPRSRSPARASSSAAGGGARSSGGDGAACAPASSGRLGPSDEPGAMVVLSHPFGEEWDGHFDGVVRPFRHGFVLGVDDALVDGHKDDRRRSLFVDAFGENPVLRGERILEECLGRHLAGGRWEDVEHLWDALRQVARAELREGPEGALALLRGP